MDLGDGFPKFVATQSVGAKVWIFHMQRQPDKVIKIWLASFLWDAWVKCKTFSNPKLPKKHDTVNHFGPSQMVLEFISVRQSFPNNLIFKTSKCKALIIIMQNEILHRNTRTQIVKLTITLLWYLVPCKRNKATHLRDKPIFQQHKRYNSHFTKPHM